MNLVQDQDVISNVKHDILAEVAENKKQTGQNFERLKARFIGPMTKFYGEAMNPNGTIFERLGAIESSVKGLSEDGNFFGAISYMGG